MRTAGETVEHDWHVAPGTDVYAITIQLDERSTARVTSNGDLLLRSGRLSVAWKAPLSYQQIGGTRRIVASRYLVNGRRISIALAPYRHDLPLVIDPVIDFSYAVNGSADDRGFQVALDGAGNIYIAGFTLSTDYQTTPGAAFRSPVPFPGGAYQGSSSGTLPGRLEADLLDLLGAGHPK